jgi:hypothetical protein
MFRQWLSWLITVSFDGGHFSPNYTSQVLCWQVRTAR